MKTSHSIMPVTLPAICLLLAYGALNRTVGDERKSLTRKAPAIPERLQNEGATDPDEPDGDFRDLNELIELIEKIQAKNPDPAVAVKDFSEAQKLKILQSVVEHLLTSKSMADSRGFYRDGGEKLVGLVDSEALNWPTNFPKKIGEYELIRMSEQKADDLEDRAPFLLIRLDKFLSPTDSWQRKMWDAPICAILSNYGSPIIGGCFTWYAPVLKKKTWIAECQGSKDP